MSRPSLPLSTIAVAVTILGALFAVVPAAHAAVWTTAPGTRVFPATHPGAHQTVSLSAAGGEYEGAIIGLRGSVQRHAVVTWSSDSDPFLVQNAILDQVAFVRITHPTTGTGAKAGLYPDPLLPRRFAQTLTVPSRSSSLYVLFHVPYGTAAGTYSGSLHVVNGAEQVDVPVALKVWSFGWQRLSVHTAFAVGNNVPNPQAAYACSWTTG